MKELVDTGDDIVRLFSFTLEEQRQQYEKQTSYEEVKEVKQKVSEALAPTIQVSLFRGAPKVDESENKILIELKKNLKKFHKNADDSFRSGTHIDPGSEKRTQLDTLDRMIEDLPTNLNGLKNEINKCITDWKKGGIFSKKDYLKSISEGKGHEYIRFLHNAKQEIAIADLKQARLEIEKRILGMFIFLVKLRNMKMKL